MGLSLKPRANKQQIATQVAVAEWQREHGGNRGERMFYRSHMKGCSRWVPETGFYETGLPTPTGWALWLLTLYNS